MDEGVRGAPCPSHRCFALGFLRLGNFGGRAAGQGAPGQNDQPGTPNGADEMGDILTFDILLMIENWQPVDLLLFANVCWEGVVHSEDLFVLPGQWQWT